MEKRYSSYRISVERGRRQIFHLGEGIYERQFEAGRLGGGLKHTQSWTDNTYSGTVGGRTKMKQSETYLYTEFSDVSRS